MASHRLGVLYALLAYSSWGLFPVYWKLLSTIPALDILGYRMVWASLLLLGILFLQHRGSELLQFARQPRRALPLLASASILAVNWGLYIYGVNSGRIVETSLGYFINPLVNVLLGVLVLRERLPWIQWLAIGLAAVGVTYAVLAVGQPPWIALTLAISFGCYGLLRKLIVVEPLLGLSVETCLMAPLALVYLILQGQPLVQQTIPTGLLLVGCGVVTAFPLFCFNSAAQHLPLSTLGFFQYIAPTVQLTLGIWLYQEPFTPTNWVVFGCIWLALALYSSTLWLIPKTQS